MTNELNFRNRLYDGYVSTFKGAAAGCATDNERGWRRWADRRFAPLLSRIPRSGRVLELGCGSGTMLAYLRDLGFRSVEGIDISKEQVEIARSRSLDARVADVFEVLSATDNPFDAVLAIDFVEHFTKAELFRMLPLLHDAIRPGGYCILQTPNGEGLFPGQVIYSDLTHLTVLTSTSCGQLFRLHGFEDFASFESGPVANGVKGWIRVAAWRAIRAAANAMRAIESGKRQSIWTENMICVCRRGR